MELLLLGKAVAVAVWAPDMVLPSPTAPGEAGLLCLFVAITTSLCSSLVTGMGCGGERVTNSKFRVALVWGAGVCMVLW